MAAAYKLLKSDNNYEVIILEKESNIGGLCKTTDFENVRCDCGVHFYRISEHSEVNDLIYNLFNIEDGESKYLNSTERKKYVKAGKTRFNSNKIMLINKNISNIYFCNEFFNYPIKFNFNTIRKIGIVEFCKIAISYLENLFHKKEESNLENYYINRYGKKFYEMFFLGYTIKVCGVSPKDISVEWGKQRIRDTSLINILKEKILNIRNFNNEPSLIDEYYYPKHGTGEVYEELAKEIVNLGGEIITDCHLKSIDIKDFNVENIAFSNNGILKQVKPDYLINTIPIKEFISLLDGVEIDEKIKNYANKLPFRDLILVNLLISKNDMRDLKNYHIIKDNSWVFIQEPKIKFGRIKIANNWSKYLFNDEDAYNNNVLMTLEYYVSNDDCFHVMNDTEIIKIVKNELDILKLLPQNGFLNYEIKKIRNAYPSYYGTYENRNKIMEYLGKFKNVFFAGRAGLHQYIDMDVAIVSGFRASESIMKK